MDATLVDRMYREEGVDFQTAETSLAEVVGKAANLPLLAQPGAEWNYSIATDVLGHLVAVISGQPFDECLRSRSSGRPVAGAGDTEQQRHGHLRITAFARTCNSNTFQSP
jgi:Beta-lactamase